MTFTRNDGQLDPQAKFLSRGVGYSVFFTPTEIVLALHDRGPLPTQAHGDKGSESGTAETAVLRMKLIGGNPNPKVSSLEQLPGKSNYLIGNDPTKWRTNVPNYAKIKYESVYPGVDLVYYGNHRQLEFDFIVAPGADPNVIGLAFQGADETELDASGNFLVHLGGGPVHLKRPFIYQEVNGIRQEVPGGYVLRGNREIAFQVVAYDTAKPLVIDPILTYSTYLGGSQLDNANAIAVDPTGNAYVIGHTYSLDFPTVNALQPTSSTITTFVAKFDADDSTLLYSTYIGGNSNDIGLGIAADSSGNVYITGVTTSSDFPILNAVQPTGRGVSDAFVTKINSTGSALVYSTYLGGSSDSDEDAGRAIAVDTAGNAYVTGNTGSRDFPTAGAVQPRHGGGETDAFVAKLNAAGNALIYSTYLGGNTYDYGFAIALDLSGSAYVTGYTSSRNFPTTSALQPVSNSTDAFVTKLNPAGSALVYSTYLGGEGVEEGYGIAVDAIGNAYVTGLTTSTDFPTANALQPTFGGIQDAFVAKLNGSASVLVYSTYLGGSDDDRGAGIVLDSAGNAYVVGSTRSNGFPTVNAFQPTYGGGDCSFVTFSLPCRDTFVAKFDATGSTLMYSSYLGGSHDDEGTGIAVDAGGNVFVTGSTSSTNFPTEHPFQPAFTGTTCFGAPCADAFVAKIASGETAPTLSVENVTWINMINAAANGNSLEKSCSDTRCADAGAISQQSIVSGDGYVEFTAAGPELLYIGLSRGSIDTAFSEIEFAIRLHHRKATVWENGVGKKGKKGRKASIGFRRGDVFRVAVFCGVVEYSKNGAVFYRSDVAPTYPLLVDTSLIGRQAVVSGAMIAGNL